MTNYDLIEFKQNLKSLAILTDEALNFTTPNEKLANEYDLLFYSILNSYTRIRFSDEYSYLPKTFRNHITQVRAYLIGLEVELDNDKNFNYRKESGIIREFADSIDNIVFN